MVLSQVESQRWNAILNSALKEFVTRGYDEASTNRIAKDAGISKALMFHYVHNKQALFLQVYDYFFERLEKEYYDVMQYEEPDIFIRLYQSLSLQLKLIEKYPYILEFHKLSYPTSCESINTALETRTQKMDCSAKLFDHIDKGLLKEGLSVEICKQVLYWSIDGFIKQKVEEIKIHRNIDVQAVLSELEMYMSELKKVFYK